MRAGSGLRVVLHGPHGLAGHGEALDRAVVQVDLGDGAGGRQRGGIDGEAVVLAGDRDPPASPVAHRLVAAVMAELELERPAAEGQAEELVPQADAEDGASAPPPARGRCR